MGQRLKHALGDLYASYQEQALQAMEMEAGRPSPRKRKLAALEAPAAAKDQEQALPGADGGERAAGDRISNLSDSVLEAGHESSSKKKLAAPAAADGEAGMEGQEPPLPGADGCAADRISHLPDDVLGDIISLLPTQEGARTQILASRWRHLWRSAPLNLEHYWRSQDENHLDAFVSRVLSAHPGPGRRFCAPLYHLHGDRETTADAWLRSPALDNLQELELCGFRPMLPYPPKMPQPLPAAAFRFCDTLCVATIGYCYLPDSTTQAIHFPKLKKLGLERVTISESSLHTMIASCPALECLLITNSSGFRCVRINSITLRSIGVEGSGYHNEGLRFEELIIENAPCLKMLIHARTNLQISVISAPKLETLGYLSSTHNKLTFGGTSFDSTIIQGLCVDSLISTVRTVKILAVDLRALSLDAVIDLMRCFPCLEKLYIESTGPGKPNFWRRKHQDLIRSFDIRVKTIALRYYRGIKSHVDFATFFVLNARVLELMILHVHSMDYNQEFFAQQRKMLQLDSKASRAARLRFTPNWSHWSASFLHVHDLDLADPFERKDPYEFYALS